jgi:hypothetical protein
LVLVPTILYVYLNVYGLALQEIFTDPQLCKAGTSAVIGCGYSSGCIFL